MSFVDSGLSEYEKTVRDHGLLAAIAFLVLIPVGRRSHTSIPPCLHQSISFSNKLAVHPEGV